MLYICKKINNMDQQKEVKLIKAFHVSPATAAEFDQMRLDLQRRAGTKVTGSDFFAHMVKTLKEQGDLWQIETIKES